MKVSYDVCECLCVCFLNKGLCKIFMVLCLQLSCMKVPLIKGGDIDDSGIIFLIPQ